MQISPLLPQLNSPAAIASVKNTSGANTPVRGLYEERIHTSQSQTNISYSDNNISMNLSISTHSTYIESMYTELGTFDSAAPQGSLDIMSVPTKNIMDGPSPQSNQMFENAMNKYMEMISSQVENLLTKIAELQQKMLDQTGGSGDEIGPAFGSGSAVKGYSVYSSQTLVSTLEITGGAPVSDSGYYSPEKTAERIINFALSFFDGGDRQEYAEMVKAAVMKGFDQAMDAFGGVLPPQTYDTVGLVNSAIDNFAAGNDINMSA